MKLIRVKKGVNLYINERDKFNSAIFQVDFIFPTDAQLFARINILSGLLKKHSTKYQENQQLVDFLEDHYGAILDVEYDFFGNLTSISFTISFVHPKMLNNPNYCFRDLILLIEDIIFNQNDRLESFFENEKKYCKNLLKDELTDPETLIYYQALPHYISSSKLNIPFTGTFTQLNAVELNPTYDLWQNILQTSAVNIYYDGFSLTSDDRRSINQLAQRFFPRSDFQINSIYYIEPKQSNEVFYEQHRIFQQHLFLQQYYLDGQAKFREENYASWLVFNQIFGADSESFLFKRIRMDLNLSYSVSSNISFGLNCFYVYGTLNSKDFNVVEHEIEQILKQIKEQNYSLEFLNVVKKSIKNSILFQTDGRFYDILQQKMKFLIPNYLTDDQLMVNIDAVTPDDLTDCVMKIQPGIKIWYEGCNNEF